MGDRIAIMHEGVLQQVGPPQHVYEQPANLFVARFIGTPPMNTVAGTVIEEDGSLFVDVEGSRLRLPSGHDGAVAAAGTRAIVIGVRPEHLVLDQGGAIPATITVIESLGHERHIICRLADGQMVIVRQQADQPAPVAGTSVRLGADPAHLHLFDAETELRLEPV